MGPGASRLCIVPVPVRQEEDECCNGATTVVQAESSGTKDVMKNSELVIVPPKPADAVQSAVVNSSLVKHALSMSPRNNSARASPSVKKLTNEYASKVGASPTTPSRQKETWIRPDLVHSPTKAAAITEEIVTSPTKIAAMRQKFGEVEHEPKSPGVSKLREVWEEGSQTAP